MMDEAGDWFNPERTQPLELRVDCAPMKIVKRIRRDFFPENRETQRAQTEFCKRVEIAQPRAMPGLIELAEVAIADAIDRRLDPAPNLQWFVLR